MSRRIYSWMFFAVMLGAAVGCGPMPEPGEEGADPGESAGELSGAGGLVTIRSGLGWPSGAYSGEGTFMNLRRNRPLDLCLTFGNGTRTDASWREVENQVGAQAKEAFRQGCAKYLFALRIFFAQGWYIVAYSLGIYLLNLFLATMDAAQGVELMRLIPSRTVIPIHYNDFTVYKSPLDDFRRAVVAAGLQERVRYIAHGQTHTFPVPVRPPEPA